jgi:hypothetical protein
LGNLESLFEVGIRIDIAFLDFDFWIAFLNPAFVIRILKFQRKGEWFVVFDLARIDPDFTRAWIRVAVVTGQSSDVFATARAKEIVDAIAPQSLGALAASTFNFGIVCHLFGSLCALAVGCDKRAELGTGVPARRSKNYVDTDEFQ